jgi:hypothetical protein
VGFGVKYANPATLPGSSGRDIAFVGTAEVAVGHNSSPFVSAYPWTPGVGFGVKYADPAGYGGGSVLGIDFDGTTEVALAHAGTPFVTAYPWTPGVGFGVKYADPATLPPNIGADVAFR